MRRLRERVQGGLRRRAHRARLRVVPHAVQCTGRHHLDDHPVHDDDDSELPAPGGSGGFDRCHSRSGDDGLRRTGAQPEFRRTVLGGDRRRYGNQAEGSRARVPVHRRRQCPDLAGNPAPGWLHLDPGRLGRQRAAAHARGQQRYRPRHLHARRRSREALCQHQPRSVYFRRGLRRPEEQLPARRELLLRSTCAGALRTAVILRRERDRDGPVRRGGPPERQLEPHRRSVRPALPDR